MKIQSMLFIIVAGFTLTGCDAMLRAAEVHSCFSGTTATTYAEQSCVNKVKRRQQERKQKPVTYSHSTYTPVYYPKSKKQLRREKMESTRKRRKASRLAKTLQGYVGKHWSSLEKVCGKMYTARDMFIKVRTPDNKMVYGYLHMFIKGVNVFEKNHKCEYLSVYYTKDKGTIVRIH